MKISRIKVERFKRVRTVEFDLRDINVFVGGNNSGKSSVLQGIHFFVIASIAQHEADQATFPQDALLFCPAHDFTTLRNGGAFRNQSNFAHLTVTAESDDGPQSYRVRIYRGRNEGNVGCERRGPAALANLVSSSERLFSVYVPGLAGVPRSEEYRTESVVSRGVAGGEANLYLRNVLYLIEQAGKTDTFVKWVRTIFPKFHLWIDFDPKRDVHIDVRVGISGPQGARIPLELAGTGLLQALQIFSYVTLFEPSLLLLDEPDAHLHADNQTVLAAALQTVVQETDTRVVISTHSRHLVDALAGVAHFVWMKDGEVVEQGTELERVSLLMDLGALDTFERLRAGEVEHLILTEDTNWSLLQVLCEANGLDSGEALFWSYKSASRLASAVDIAAFVRDVAPNTQVVIHRDRDFLGDDEAETVRGQVEAVGAELFLTEGSDIESYFSSPEHLAESLGEALVDVSAWIEELAAANHNDLIHSYIRKRDEVKFQLYKGNAAEAPDSKKALGTAVPLPGPLRKGKTMLTIIRGAVHGRFGVDPDLAQPSDALEEPQLVGLFELDAP